MKVEVRLFARFRELAGAGSVSLELPPGATVADLRRVLGEKVPAVASLLAKSAVAVNNQFAEDAQPLPENAEVALLPPVSGGGV